MKVANEEDKLGSLVPISFTAATVNLNSKRSKLDIEFGRTDSEESGNGEGAHV